jgi:hypothetical protein
MSADRLVFHRQRPYHRTAVSSRLGPGEDIMPEGGEGTLGPEKQSGRLWGFAQQIHAEDLIEDQVTVVAFSVLFE